MTAETIQKAIRSGIESEAKARRVAQEAIRANEEQFDTTELVRLLEEEMLEAARNLEFERAAQLRDKLNELKGAPTIKSGSGWSPSVSDDPAKKIWEPRSKGRGKRGVAR